MAAASGGSEAAKCNVRRYFGSIKGTATAVRQVWRGRGRRGGS